MPVTRNLLSALLCEAFVALCWLALGADVLRHRVARGR